MAEPVSGLPDRPLDLVLALAPLAGTRRLGALAGNWSGTRLLITADPVAVLGHPAGSVTDLDSLAAWLDSSQVPLARGMRAPAGAVGGGLLTLLGHGVGRLTGRVRTAAPTATDPRLPDAVIAVHDHVLRHDGERWWAEALDTGDGAPLAHAHRLADDARAACAHEVRRLDPADVTLTAVPDAARHMAAVEQVVTAIRGGDIAQANVCARFGLQLSDGGPTAVRAWVALVAALDPDRAALVTGPWGALVGASPELYLGVSGGHVTSAPIKGTRPAGDDAALLASEKDVSENVMIVDLVRNDLSRVCEPGSVTVDDLLQVRPHAGVAHLVSRVSGTLLPRTGPGALVAATFPPGSVTGTPKQRATEVTDTVEPAARGAHTGAVGWLGPMLGDLAVTIRSVEVGADGIAALGVGGGVVADSTPAEEWHEVLTKAAPLLSALGTRAPPPGPTTAAHKGLADAGKGLIETILVVDGRAVEGEAHLARLRRSYWELTGHDLDRDSADDRAPGRLVADAAAAAGPGAHRMRLRCPLPDRTTAGATRTHVAVEVEGWRRPVPVAQQDGLVLGVLPAPEHGLERHKFADRSWLDRAAAVPAVDDVAFWAADPAGLLETSRGCLLALLPPTPGSAAAGTLLTPACDGRILPGVTRQVLVDLAVSDGWQVSLAALDEDVLARADALLTCNALRGAQWVRELRPVSPDPEEFPGSPGHDAPTSRRTWDSPSPSAVRLSAALLHRWQLA